MDESPFFPKRALRAGLISASMLALSAQAAEKPNVILIVADDLGAGDLSCYGATKLATPNIDALASQGVRMTDACASSAVSQPSRYSILTGEYANRIQRQGEYQTYFRNGQQTIATVLQAAGYRTAAVGKWHNGFTRGAEPDYNRRNLVANKAGVTPHSPLDIGFDSYFGPPRSHNEPPYVFLETAEDSAGKFLRIHQGDAGDPVVIMPRQDPAVRPFNDYGYGISTGAAAAHAARPDTQIDMILANRVADEVRKHKDGDKPFFYYVPFTAPHVPIGPSKANVGRSQAGAYGDFIMQMDDCVGVITQALKDKSLDDNTMVIITSDNGALTLGPAQAVDTETGAKLVDAAGNPYPEMRWTNNRPEHRGNGAMQGQKTDAWEGGHRVPFIVKWPAGGIPAGAVSDKLIGLTDIMATVAAAAEAPIPAGAGVDSLNQLPLLTAPATHAAIRTEMLILGTKSYMLRHTDTQGTKWSYIPARGTGGESVPDPIPTGWKGWGQPYRNQGWTNSDIDTSTGLVKAGAPDRQLYDLSKEMAQQVPATNVTNVVVANQALADSLAARFNVLYALGAANRAPVVAQAIAAQSASVGSAFILQVAGTAITDPDKDTLIYGATGLPPGLSFAPFTRTISGIPTTIGAYTVQVRAEDGRGGSVTASFALAVGAGTTPASALRDYIYTDFNANDVLKTGWAQSNLNTMGTLRSTGTTRNGSLRSYSIAFGNANAYAGLKSPNLAFDTQRYASVSFWVNGGVTGGQDIEFQAVRADNSAKGFRLPTLKAGQWQQITIPLADVGAAGIADLAHLRFVNRGAGAAKEFYVDDLSFDVLTQPSTIVYAEGIRTGWAQQNRTCSGTLLNTVNPHAGLRSYSIVFTAADAYAGLWSQAAPYNVGTQASLTFWIHGGSAGGQSIEIQGVRANGATQGKLLDPLAAGTWRKVTVYLDELGILGASDLSAIRFYNRGGAAAPVFYVDDVSFDEAIPSTTSGPG
jgi:arylsulfatase A-like enzyme